MTWAEFKAAVDALLLTDAVRQGTITGKILKVKLGAKKLQQVVEKYRLGHQNTFVNDGTPASSLMPSGFAASGSLPEDCEPRDAYVIRKKSKAVNNTVDTVNDQITVTGHGLSAVTSISQVVPGQFRNTGGAVPTGLVVNQSYYLRVVDTNTLTLHTSLQGAIDNTTRVDITANGTGTTTLDYLITRFSCARYKWENRYDLIHKQACLNDGSGLVAFDPNGQTFYLFPFLPVGDDVNGYNWSFELNWDGVKIEWDDADASPFDDAAAEAVAEYVREWFARHVSRDLQQADVAMKAFKANRTDLYLRGRHQKNLRS